MITRIAIDNDLFLFKNDSSVNDLVISSHGGYISRPEIFKENEKLGNIPGFGGWFPVPNWTQLFFYTPHKTSLLDPTIEAFLDGNFMPYEIIHSGKFVRNYGLEKYQTSIEKNPNGENYEKIITEMENYARIYNTQLRTQHVIKNKPINPIRLFDVLTIRNRFSTRLTGVNLKDVLGKLEREGRYYDRIHCVFCRTSTLFREKGSLNAISYG